MKIGQIKMYAFKETTSNLLPIVGLASFMHQTIA